jgi:hypothetical protein
MKPTTTLKHSNMKSLIILATALSLTVTALQSRAAVIIGNLPPTNDGTGTGLNGATQKAMVFTMDSTAYTVDTVILRLQDYSTAAGDAASVGFFLDNGAGTNTGAATGSLLAPDSASDAVGDFTFLPAAPITLAANTTYWLLVDRLAGDFAWKASAPALTPTGAGATFSFARNSTNDGASYGNSSFLNSFQINGTSVPEPSTALLGMLGLGALILRRTRNHRST